MNDNKSRPVVRRPRKGGDKPPMPTILEPVAIKAKDRLRARHVNPGVAVEVEKVSQFGYRLASPHSDHESWEAMICDALGTRSVSTAKTFVHSLTQLCSQSFHPIESEEGGGEWCPDEFELNMVLNIATSIKPRNEMEAALAAQMTAVHMMTNHHQHVHIEGGGSEIGGQACEPSDSRNGGNNRGAAGGEHERCPALPGPDASGVVVPMSRHQGQEPVPDTRRGKRIGSAKGSR